MAARLKQRYPTWWQALILLGSGVVIAFSSCVGVLTGIGGGQSAQLGKLFTIGFFVGVAAFIVGLVLMLVVAIRALFFPQREPVLVPQVPLQPGGVISRATHPHLFPDASPDAAAVAQVAQPAAPPAPGDPTALVGLRVAIFASILYGTAELVRQAALPRWSPYLHHYFLMSVAGFVLSQLPYVFVLVRTWRIPDRAAVALALAAGCAYSIFGTGFLVYWQYPAMRMNPTLWIGGALQLAIVVLALLVRKGATWRDGGFGLVVTFFFSMLIYAFLVRTFLHYLSLTLISR
jgi:hypothetical protein